MKKLKTILSMALCTALLFATACSGGNSSSGGSSGGTQGSSLGGNGEGRYVETDITPPGVEDELFLLKAKDGGLVALNGDFSQRWDSADGGKTWTEGTGPAGSLEIGWVANATLAEDGSIIAALVTMERLMGNNYSFELYRFADGSAEPLELDGFDGSGYVNGMQALPDGRLYISFAAAGAASNTVPHSTDDEGGMTEQDGDTNEPDGTPGTTVEGGEDGNAENGEEMPAADESPDNDEEPNEDADAEGAATWQGYGEETKAVYDLATGEKLYNVSGSEPYLAATGNGKLYIMDYEMNVYAYDLSGDFSTPEKLGGFTSGAEFIGSLSFAADENGNVYFTDGSSLQKLDGEETTTLLEGSAYSFGDPSSPPSALAALDDGSFVMAHTTDNGGLLSRYEWDPDAKLDPEKTLRVWALSDSSSLRAAMSEFRKKYPDGAVELDIPATGEGGMQTSDAIRNLNTEILNGSGPDVIILDGTPIESYVNQGVLADLSDLVDTSGMYKSLLEPFEADGSIYYLPTRFSMPILAGTQQYLVDSMDALVKAVQGSPNTPANIENPFDALPEEERNLLGLSNLDELFDLMWASSAAGVIENNTLNTQALKSFLDNLKAISDHYSLGSFGADDMAGGASMVFSTGGASFSSLEGSALAYLSGRSNLAATNANDLLTFEFLLQYTGTEFVNFPGLVDGVWQPDTMAGVNAGSGKQALAAEFISIMLGESVQGARLGDGGFPVTRAGMQAQAESLANVNFAEDDTQKLVSIDEATMAGIIANLKAPNLVDNELTDKIHDVAVLFCQGGTDLEGAVSQIEQDIKNYLAERQ